MRLFDKLISTTKITQHYSDIKNANVLCADAIASYYADTPADYWGSDKYPHAIPCWNEFFIEWNQPQRWNRGGQKAIEGGFGMQQAGLLGVVYSDARAVREQLSIVTGLPSGTAAQAQVLVVSQPVICMDGAVLVPDCKAIWALKADGWVICHFLQGTAVDELPPEDVRPFSEQLGTFDHIAMLAFTFANCCNVKLEDATDELQPDAKIRRRLRIPEVKRYTLNIAGHVARPSRDYNQGTQGVMPFHLCRGHFATYTAEKPMFGNPKLVGRYWHPPHMKGKKENGEVVKDYAIAAGV